MKTSNLTAVLISATLLSSLAIGCSSRDSASPETSLLGPAEPAAKLTVSARSVAGTRERSPLRPAHPQETELVLDQGRRFRYAVDECAPMLLTRGGLFAEDAVTAQGNAIHLRHILDTFCSASQAGALELRPTIDGTRITIDEVFTGLAVRCTCPFPVSATLTGLAPGAYTVEIVYAVERDGRLEAPEVLYQTRVVVADEEDAGPAGPGEPFPGIEADVVLTAAADGRTADLPGLGARLAVVLEGNPSTGYNWLVDEVDDSVLRLVGDPEFLADDPTLVGSGGRLALRFQAVGSGRTLLRLVYRRPWETDVAPLQTFEVQVVVR